MPAEPIDLTEEKVSSSVILDTRRTRPRFFDGKFLTAADLMQEQSYLLTRQADLGRTLGFGVITGLRVQRATRSASDLPNPAASVKVTRGHGLTPAGDFVFLPQDLTVNLDNVALMQRLNAAFGLTREPQPAFQSLRGLYVLGLRAVEFTANPTPTYPPSVDGNSALRDGEVIEATALTLVPYDSDASRKDTLTARSRAAREIFLEQKIAPLPAGVLPLALLYLRNGALEWADEWLVRREAGDDDRFGFGFAPRALAEAHFYHYQEMLKLAPTAADGQLTGQSFLEIAPAAGPLPANVVNAADFTQAFFPPEARVELALVPEDELAALMEDAIDLPPIDFSLRPEDQDALAILVLAPVKRSDYGNVLQTLKRTPQPVLRNPAPPLLGQQKPIQALLRLNATFELKRRIAGAGNGAPAASETVSTDFIDPAWREALKKSGSLWYLRRRNLPDGSGLAGTPLAARASEVPSPTRPAEPETPRGVVMPIDDRDFPVVASNDREAKLAKLLEAEGLWGRFAFLRAISDAPTHAALTRLLTNSVVMKNPILQQAVFTALERKLPAISESPEENFEQIQKDSDVKVLTPCIVAEVARQFIRTELLRGLEIATRDHPKLLSEKRLRFVLGRTNHISTLAEIGLRHARHEDFKKLMETVEKQAATGRAQAVSDAVERFLKKVNA
jgi:hypothetical protein